MKLLLNLLGLALFLWLGLPQAQAQGQRMNADLQQRFSQAKLMQLKNELALSDETAAALKPIYERYEAEMNALPVSRRGNLLRVNPDSLSREEADKLVARQLENAVSISTIRQKYYAEFKTVLSPQQVIKMYQSEAKIKRGVLNEFRKRRAVQRDR